VTVVQSRFPSKYRPTGDNVIRIIGQHPNGWWRSSMMFDDTAFQAPMRHRPLPKWVNAGYVDRFAGRTPRRTRLAEKLIDGRSPVPIILSAGHARA